MLKVWCVILILGKKYSVKIKSNLHLKKTVFLQVAPISCGPIEEGTGKHLFQILCEYVWQEKCKNVSGVTIDDKRNNQLNLDYGICTTTAINENELKQDVASIFPDFDPNKMKDFHFTEKKKFDLVNMSQKWVSIVIPSVWWRSCKKYFAFNKFCNYTFASASGGSSPRLPYTTYYPTFVADIVTK